MKPFLTIILKYSLILFVIITTSFWLFGYSDNNLPQYIPHTPIRINGAVIAFSFLTIIILAQKEVLRSQPDVGIKKLMFISSLIVAIAEISFQPIRASTFEDNKFHEFLYGFAGSTVISIILSFFAAYQLKTKKSGLLILFFLILTVVFSVLKYFYPSLGNSH